MCRPLLENDPRTQKMVLLILKYINLVEKTRLWSKFDITISSLHPTESKAKIGCSETMIGSTKTKTSGSEAKMWDFQGQNGDCNAKTGLRGQDGDFEAKKGGVKATKGASRQRCGL